MDKPKLTERRKPSIVKSIAENRKKLFEAYEKHDIVVPAYPQKIQVEVTNYCNFRCKMCPSLVMEREKGTIDDGLYNRIIEEIAEKTDIILYHIMGEPFLVKALPRYIEQAANQGLNTAVVTNGSLLTETVIDRVLEADLDYICISIDGGKKETYESIRKGADYIGLCNNIEYLAKRRTRAGSHLLIGIQMTVMYENQDEFSDLKERWEGIVDFIRSKTYFKWAKKPNELGDDNTDNRRCDRLWFYTAVGWNGEMGMCCLDYELDKMLGNVRDESLFNLWNSLAMQRLRDMHQEAQRRALPLCDSCGYFSEPDASIQLQKDMTTLEREIYRTFTDRGGKK